MFEPLLTRLAPQFHLVAPDYPGFGHSDAPTPREFSYTFDHIAAVMNHFTEALPGRAERSSSPARCGSFRIGHGCG
jgi:pimeloyl-ACP methyl ester carboxylesterase